VLSFLAAWHSAPPRILRVHRSRRAPPNLVSTGISVQWRRLKTYERCDAGPPSDENVDDWPLSAAPSDDRGFPVSEYGGWRRAEDPLAVAN
jgi:hypothetical protein